MASRRFLQAASRRLRVGARAASDDARIVERATRGQVEMRQFGIESLGGAGMHAPHVAIFGAGFVGVNTALALLMCAQLPPVGPMTRTDALDAGAARKEAYEEAA